MSEEKTTYRFRVGYHEWAWSLRTSGMPVWALAPTGRLIEIGVTEKRPTTYESPSKYVLRRYTSNSGLRTYYLYDVSGGQPRLVTDFDERYDWEPVGGINKVVEKVDPEYVEAVRKLYQTLKTENSVEMLIEAEGR